MDYLPQDRQLFRRAETFGDALRQIARTISPHRTAKVIGRRWDIEDPTAEHVTKGHAAGPTVLKALRAEGEHAWAFWDALGELLIGESREAYDERQVRKLIEKTNEARARLEARKARRLELESAMGLASAEDR
ncbi:hypothetical protein [Phenylobacterium sp.]|uniref:hypothetical protein n=1 Tax=Phenylobacterium sp. TaxID=1871053 RepID=UPI0026194DE9|nr:hypothetical protein [Phenylobacterium sp.]